MFLDPAEASLEEKLDLAGEKGENREAAREVARTGGLVESKEKMPASSDFSRVIFSQKDSITLS